jgi:sporulation protein YlmC with PRC-barrel domain
MLIRKIDGKQVVSSDARVVGEVSGAYVDLETWKIDQLAVDLNNETIELLGFKKPRTPFMGTVSVYMPIDTVKVAGDIITLKTKYEELPNLPIDKTNT